jgi:TRAP-type uncharacterized transport system fused permease subunit
MHLTWLGVDLSLRWAGSADSNLPLAQVLTIGVTIIMSMGLLTAATKILHPAMLEPAVVTISAGSMAGTHPFEVGVNVFKLAIIAAPLIQRRLVPSSTPTEAGA